MPTATDVRVKYIPKGRHFIVEARYFNRQYSIRLTKELKLQHGAVPLFRYAADDVGCRHPEMRSPHSNFGAGLVASMIEVGTAEGLFEAELEKDRASRAARLEQLLQRRTHRRVQRCGPQLLEALKRMLELVMHATPEAFFNGVTDSTGGIDEGDVIAGRIIDEARAAVAAAEGKDNFDNRVDNKDTML